MLSINYVILGGKYLKNKKSDELQFDCKVTLAYLKDKPVQTSSSSSLGIGGGVRSAAARFLAGGNGNRLHSFAGGSKLASSTNSRIGSLGTSISNSVAGNSNFDGKGTYLIFNISDAIFISDLNSHDKVL